MGLHLLTDEDVAVLKRVIREVLKTAPDAYLSPEEALHRASDAVRIHVPQALVALSPGTQPEDYPPVECTVLRLKNGNSENYTVPIYPQSNRPYAVGYYTAVIDRRGFWILLPHSYPVRFLLTQDLYSGIATAIIYDMFGNAIESPGRVYDPEGIFWKLKAGHRGLADHDMGYNWVIQAKCPEDQ